MEKMEEQSVLEQCELFSHGKYPTLLDRNPQSDKEKQFWEPSFITSDWRGRK